jgi:hypothetical protein
MDEDVCAMNLTAVQDRVEAEIRAERPPAAQGLAHRQSSEEAHVRGLAFAPARDAGLEPGKAGS